MQKSVIKVSGMSCKHCEKTVKDAVSALPGVKSATADHKKGQLAVTHNMALCSLAAIKQAVAESGYQAV